MTRPLSPVVRRKGVMGGRACIRGTTWLADPIIKLFHGGQSIRALAKFYRLTEQQVSDCIRWHLRGRRWAKKAGRK